MTTQTTVRVNIGTKTYIYSNKNTTKAKQFGISSKLGIASKINVRFVDGPFTFGAKNK